MLDKLKFNNLVISNAKVIQKVRIQIVRKIIQRMRKLKDLLEKQTFDRGNIVKQRKCVAIVECVKKMKREDVIRNILLLEKDPNKIVTNSQSTPEDVAIAMFATNKIMQELALRFRQELNLNEAEASSWRKTLIEIGKLKAKKLRRKKRAEQKAKQPKEKVESELNKEKQAKKKPKAVENGTTSKLTKKATKQINSDEEESDIEEEADMDESTFVVKTKLEKTNNIANKKSKAKAIESVEEDDESMDENDESMDGNDESMDESDESIDEYDTSIDEDDESMDEDDEKPIKKAKTKKSETTENNKPTKNAKVKLEPANLANRKGNETSTQKTAKPKIEPIKFLSGYGQADEMSFKAVKPKAKDSAPVQVGVVDPFFITEEGKPYIANIVLKPEQIENTDNSIKPQKEFARNPKKFNSERRQYNEKPKPYRSGSTNDRQNQEVLHPSWMAKKKLNSIADFRGKKIKFGDDVSVENPVIHKSNKRTEIKETAKSDLHPSWVAKQKLKPTITAFQGKKITFGDDE